MFRSRLSPAEKGPSLPPCRISTASLRPFPLRHGHCGGDALFEKVRMKARGLYKDVRVLHTARQVVNKKIIIVGIMGVTIALLLWISYFLLRASGSPVLDRPRDVCSTVDQGYLCFAPDSHLWGQYSPYFSLANQSSVPQNIPGNCRITFAQVLSRHGARYPTGSKSDKYARLISGIKQNTTSFRGKYAFLNDYTYALGKDNLTAFGEYQLVDSGIKFYRRYESLARTNVPFIRASGSNRVIASGEKFIKGFQKTKLDDPQSIPNQTAPVISVIFPEKDGFNNTLDHGGCTKFEGSTLGHDAKATFRDVFTPTIRRRLEEGLPGAKLSNKDVVSLMDLCSYETVAATPDGSELSPFCALFSHKEWEQYDYLQSLDKYYGYGAGNPLGPTQGIGFANELIARLTKSPVHDDTSTNHTLDSRPDTFPVDSALYADFSHDSLMVSVFFALGLYNGTKPLSKTSVESTQETDGYASAWLVPFAARAYIEKMQCSGEKDPLVRVLVNDRVVPLHGCSTDQFGRCKLDDFIQGLSFVRSGGNWGDCFT
ncbi:hypothetical protein EYZ11_009876 [Aspergillus tanneri]|uniref:Phytase A n=1 Tax=Aspergillus tanneri TaxID=1220188 RepID=A0A4S3J8X5_9EURO|nr:hypothetical protein EYZ11_009876 [Aspergillus tanneri]